MVTIGKLTLTIHEFTVTIRKLIEIIYELTVTIDELTARIRRLLVTIRRLFVRIHGLTVRRSRLIHCPPARTDCKSVRAGKDLTTEVTELKHIVRGVVPLRPLCFNSVTSVVKNAHFTANFAFNSSERPALGKITVTVLRAKYGSDT